MLKLIVVSILSVSAFSCTVLAEESLSSCDVSSNFKKIGNGAEFTQTETCPDATATTKLMCTQGSNSVEAILPVGFESAAGSKIDIVFEVGTQKFSKTLNVSANSAAEILLKSGDPLWMALAKPGTVISATSETAATNIATSELSADAMDKFKSACSL